MQKVRSDKSGFFILWSDGKPIAFQSRNEIKKPMAIAGGLSIFSRELKGKLILPRSLRCKHHKCMQSVIVIESIINLKKHLCTLKYYSGVLDPILAPKNLRCQLTIISLLEREKTNTQCPVYLSVSKGGRKRVALDIYGNYEDWIPKKQSQRNFSKGKANKPLSRPSSCKTLPDFSRP